MFHIPKGLFRVLSWTHKTKYPMASMAYHARRVAIITLDRSYIAHSRRIITTTSVNLAVMLEVKKKPHSLQNK